MPTGNRIRANNVYGITSDNPLTAAATSFNSVSLPLLPVVASAHAVVVFDPKRVFGDPEIVVVTVHTAASTVATILRGTYGTSAREHPQGTAWAHVPVDEDWIEILTSSTRPTDPYEGQAIYETDTDFYKGYNGATWGTVGSPVETSPYSAHFQANPPACRVFHSVAQSILSTTVTALAFNSERYDTDNMHDTVTLNSRITINTAGLYVITGAIEFASATDYTQMNIYIRANGDNAQILAYWLDSNPGTLSSARAMTTSTIMKFAVGEYVELAVRQVNGAAAARNVNSGPKFSPEFSATWIGIG